MAASRRLRALGSLVRDRFDLPPGPVAVALSGGADSAVCAWAAVEEGVRVRAIHVHHGYPASDRLEEAATAIAERLGVDLEVLRVQVAPGSSPEGRARAARYRALTAARRPGEWILTGHTQDDQAETVLAHLLRGSGPTGLAGIPPRRPPFARPLLRVARCVTRELAVMARLPFFDDPANTDRRHLRNRIRAELLPFIEGDIAPGARRTLARTAELLRAEVETWEDRVARLPFDRRRGWWRLPRGVLRALPPAESALALRELVARAGAEYPPAADEIAGVLGLAVAGHGTLPLSGGLQARAAGPWLEVGAPTDDPELPRPLRIRAGRGARWGRWRFDVRVRDRPRVFPLSPWELTIPASPDAEVVVRRSRPDDRIALTRGSKNVADALAEVGIPPWEREGWPVVEAAGRVVWIPGVRRRAGSLGVGEGRYLSVIVSEEGPWNR